MEVKYLKSYVRDAIDVPRVMDLAGVPLTPIAHANWSGTYPYCPEAAFRIAANSHAFLLHYKVTEDTVRARYGTDNGKVWTDSCVEFFSQPAGDDIYYNLECNCVGTVLLGAGADRHDRERANAGTLASIQRWASLGRRPFEETVGERTWEVALIVPFTAFFKHRLRSVAGKVVRANFYKCGDELPRPHFLSWNPIQLPRPDFHCPAFFGELSIQSE